MCNSHLKVSGSRTPRCDVATHLGAFAPRCAATSRLKVSGSRTPRCHVAAHIGANAPRWVATSHLGVRPPDTFDVWMTQIHRIRFLGNYCDYINILDILIYCSLSVQNKFPQIVMIIIVILMKTIKIEINENDYNINEDIILMKMIIIILMKMIIMILMKMTIMILTKIIITMMITISYVFLYAQRTITHYSCKIKKHDAYS